MATVGRHAFTVAESLNMDSFNDWNYEVFDLSAGGGDTSTYATDSNPAKKVVLYHEPSTDGGTTLDNNDLLSITINGQTDTEKVIKIDIADLPFTITGLMISAFKVVSAGNESSDTISCLTFH